MNYMLRIILIYFMSMFEFHIARIYKTTLEWNTNVKPKYGTVDFDSAEISMEAAFPEKDIFCVIFTGSSHGTGEHFELFCNGNRLHLKWMFFMI